MMLQKCADYYLYEALESYSKKNYERAKRLLNKVKQLDRSLEEEVEIMISEIDLVSNRLVS